MDDLSAMVTALQRNVTRVFLGKQDVVRSVLTGLLAGGHVLLEDVPGVGKTVLAKSVARSVACEFRRVQFTPDLLPSDILGVSVYEQRTGAFEFKPGPIFTNVLLADEINRATPRTQSALLEAMNDAQVTVDRTYASAAATRSSWSRRRTRASSRARTRCPRASWIASCCGSASGTRPRTTRRP